MTNKARRRKDDGALLGLRAAVVLLFAVLAGGGATALLVMAHQPLPIAVLAGLTTLAASVRFFHWLIA
ncbi:hypothetical protein [Kutzneria buriramensis]|uniref:Uncharacterized protein n=1 Tax=Kutzneria buriramensis TaxID=1045776 RepID=A0A3E0I9H3_9PSEU|nr:hypothetical protein [Kutzneria buriramensis]REH55206.1 hypothetical protein BCF44_101223 [Kutzneria buriramensis]